MNEIELPDIAQNETSRFNITPAASLTAGYESRSYRLGIAATPTAATSLVTRTFGPSEYGSGIWSFDLTTTQTAALPIGDVFAGVWEIGRPEPVAMVRLKVGRVPGSS